MKDDKPVPMKTDIAYGCLGALGLGALFWIALFLIWWYDLIK